MNTNSFYRNALASNLARTAQMNPEAVETVCRKFDKLAAASSGETSFRVVREGYASGDVDKACATIREQIKQALEKCGGKVETNGILRWKNYAARHNELLKKMEVLVNGLPALSDAERERIKLRLPAILEKQMEAVASVKSRVKELEIEIKN